MHFIRSVARRSRVSALLLAAIFAHVAPLAAQEKSGVDTTRFDRNVRPQDDFYRYVNGGWLARATIPADKSGYGAFTMLRDQSDDAIRSIVLEAAGTANAPAGSASQKIGDFYRAYMDSARIERLGVAPIQPELDRVAKL